MSSVGEELLDLDSVFPLLSMLLLRIAPLWGFEGVWCGGVCYFMFSKS